MSLPGASHDPYHDTQYFERIRERNDSILTARATGPSRVYQSTPTSGNAQAHYGDRIMYGDSHVHYHPPSHEGGRPAPPRRPINMLRWRRDPHFVGREDTLENIKQVLGEYGCAALTGAGGVGKSQTAIEFCWRWIEENPHFSILWIYAASIQTFDAGYAELARKFRLPCSSPGSSKDDVRDGVKDWLEDNSDWLMVIDNADTYGDFFGPADGEMYDTIRDALPLPRPGAAMILYTSRHARIGEELTEHHHLHMGNLSINDSKCLLMNKLGTLISDEHAFALLEALEYLPMSIAHAAAYLKFTKIPVQHYIRRVGNDDELLDLLGSHHVHVGRRDGKAPRSAVKVILTTLDLLTLHNEHAAHLLYFMACLDRQNIPAAITSLAIGDHTASRRKLLAIELPRSQAELESAIGELESLALISRRVRGQHYTLHRLVHVTINRCMAADRTQAAYLQLCAHCLMESFFPGVGILMVHHEDGSMTSAQQSGLKQAWQSLAKYPSGFRIGLRFLCKLGIFAYADDDRPEVRELTSLKNDWLRYICLLPLEAILAAAKCDIGPDGKPSLVRRRSVQAMADLTEQGAFKQLEILALQTIEKSTAHSVSMIAAKVYLARAVAGMKSTIGQLPITTRPVAVLLREAEEEADGMPFEQSESPHAYHDHCSLAAIFLEADCYARAILLQERACDGLARIFGPMDLDVLAYRVYLAELKGPYAVDDEEFCELEQSLQKWCDRTRGYLHQAFADEQEVFIAIDNLGRVKALSCRKLSTSGRILTHHERETFLIAVNDTERILRDALLRMEKLEGLLDSATLHKTKEVYEFLRDIGPSRSSSDFAFAKATSMLEAVSDRKHMSERVASVILGNIELYVKHGNARPLCERIIFILLGKIRTQRSEDNFSRITEVICSALELLLSTRVRTPGPSGVVELGMLARHHAVCDRCDQNIIGIRHKCLQCPDYDVCSACLGLGDTFGQSCSWKDTSSGPHRFAPMYEQYDKHCWHHQASQWHVESVPIETHTVPSALRTNPGRYLVLPIRQRWHKDIADAKGYESEPDEGRRTKTQYIKHYARREAGWFDGGQALRPRARSYESLKLSFVLSSL